ncbi:ABC transporter permease, partial [Nakamurella silvestris]
MNAIVKRNPNKESLIVSRGTKQFGQRLLPWIVPILLIVIWQIASKT